LQRVALEIAAGGIIGLFTGRMEYGPRALGGRSIMARAIDHDVTAILNKRLNRSEFMPFAPVTLEDYAGQYYVGWQKAQLASRFMTVCYECTDRAKRETPGIVHVDQTARPQIINAADNALYYGILKAYHDLTGIPTLINTSFNNHEEPIVCSPKDAIESLLLDNVDYVVLEEFVVKSKRMF
jgi:carbamoyltransferase